MERTAPDVIIISRGGNDFTHASAEVTPGDYAWITDGYFDKVNWIYPDDDIIKEGEHAGRYGLLEALSVTIKKLRAAYPFTPIVLCDGLPYKRVNRSHFPVNNGQNNAPQFNKAIKEAADFFGCQLIPQSKVSITFENMYPTYIDDSSSSPTHPNEKGHEIWGKFAIDYLKNMNFDV